MSNMIMKYIASKYGCADLIK